MLLLAPDGVATDTWTVLVENPPCTLTSLLDDVSAETNVAIASPAIQIGDPIVDEDNNTIIFTVSASADISHVSMSWDLPCGAEICCNMGACSSSFIDFTANGGCHTCIVEAQAGETVTEEWTICIRRADTTPPEVTVESEIVWNCEDSIGLTSTEKGTVWIVEESVASVVAGYQAAGQMEDAVEALEDAADDALAASTAAPIAVDSLDNLVVYYVSTNELYSGAYYAVAVDSAGNVSKCLSTQMFFIDICEVEVADLCELRDSPLVWRYTVLGEIYVTYECGDITFAQDATCGIKIDDSANYNSLPAYSRGTGLTNLRGMMYDDGVMRYFVPMVCCPPTATSTGNTVTPIDLTWDEFDDYHGEGHDDEEYESMLITITNPFMVVDDYDGYAYWTYTTVDTDEGRDYFTYDGQGNSAYYILGNFSCSDYIGEDFLTVPGIYTGIKNNDGTWSNGGHITPRDEDDIVAVTGPVIEVDENPLEITDVLVGNCATETLNIYNSGIGNLPITALYLDNLTGDDTFELMTALPTNPTNIVNGTPFAVDIKWCPSANGTATTNLIIEYGVGDVLVVPINGTTGLIVDMPYVNNFDSNSDAETLEGWASPQGFSSDNVDLGWWSNCRMGSSGSALVLRRADNIGGGPVEVITPGFNISGSNPVVQFYHGSIKNSGIGTRSVWISADQVAWTLLTTMNGADIPDTYYGGSNSLFEKVVLPIPAGFIGAPAWVKFTNTTVSDAVNTAAWDYWVIENFNVMEAIVAPIISVSPDGDFGGVQVGETGTLDFSITNTGISVLPIHSVRIETVGPSLPSDFVLTDTLYTGSVEVRSGSEAYDINGEGSYDFSVSFTPEAIGISQAQIVIEYGMYDDEELVVPLQGNGLSCDVAMPVTLGVTEFYQNSWYEYTPEQFAVVTILNCWPGHDSEDDYDTYLEIYDECGGTRIAFNDDHFYNDYADETYDYYGVTGDCLNRWASKVTFVAEAGHSYKIFWRKYYSGSIDGPHMMTIVETYPLAGDLCQSAIALDLPVKNMFGTTVGFEDDYDYSSCSPSSNYMDGNDKVYSFTVPEDIANGYGYITGDIFGAYAGIHIVNVCPNADMLKENCIAFAGGSMGGSFSKRIVPGDYYCVVSSWAPPQTLEFYFNLKLESSEGVEDILSTTGIDVYPNPNNGVFTVQVNRTEAKDLVIELIDITGQILYRNDAKSVMSYKEEIDISSFAKGVYQLRVNDGTTSEVKKVVVN